ncbi:MAG: MFS transporter [Gemmataceae bacterium]
MTSRQWNALIATLPGVSLAMLHSAMIDLPQADIIDALDTDRYRFHWIQGTYLVGAASGMALTRFVAGKIGLRLAYLSGLLLFCFMAFPCGVVDDVMQMAPLRVGQGLGMGLLVAAAMVLLWRELPGLADRAMACYGLTVYFSAMLGASLGGAFTALYSWRLIFLINLPLGLLIVALAYHLLPEDRPREASPPRFDLLGFCLLVSWIASLNAVLDMGQYWGWLTSPFFVPWLAGLVVALVGFIVWGALGAEPLISLRPFRLRDFSLGLGIKCLFSINLYVLLMLLSNYMISLRGYQWWQGALVLLPGLATMGLAVIVAQLVAGRTQRRSRMAIGLAVMATATWQLSALDLYTSKYELALKFATWGIGAGLVLVPVMVTTFEGLTPAQLTTGAGIFNIARSLPAYTAGTILVTLLARTTDFYSDILGRHITHNRPIVEQVLRQSERHFAERGSPAFFSSQQARALLAKWVKANATAYAYQHVLRYLAWCPVLALLLVPFVQPACGCVCHAIDESR